MFERLAPYLRYWRVISSVCWFGWRVIIKHSMATTANDLFLRCDELRGLKTSQREATAAGAYPMDTDTCAVLRLCVFSVFIVLWCYNSYNLILFDNGYWY